MPGALFLAGDRVDLYTVEEEDLPFVRDGVNHPSVRAPVGQSFPTNLPLERRYFEEANDSDEVIQLLVVDDGERVGCVELDAIDRESGTADVAFWIAPNCRRRGYGEEALALAVEYAFDELRLHKVTADAYGFNDASRSLLREVGFVEEGVGREDAFVGGDYVDTHYFGLLESEWRATES